MSEKIDEELLCVICTEILYKAVSLNCGHSFCRECLENSLKIKPICPMCRQPSFLSAKNLKENFTLNNLIKNQYANLIFERDQLSRVDQQIRQNVQKQENEEQEVKRYFALELSRSSNFLFNQNIGQIHVKFGGPVDLLYTICQDRRFVMIPKLINKFPFITNIVECLQYKASKDGFKLTVKVIDRIQIQKIEPFANESEELKQQFGLSDHFQFISVIGSIFYDDFKQMNDDINQITEITLSVKGQLKIIMNNMTQSSPNLLIKLAEKIGPQNFEQMINTQQLYDFKSISQFSQILCGILNSPHKQRMFETQNALERLLLIQKIIDQSQECLNQQQIFDLEIQDNFVFLENQNTILFFLGILFMIYYYSQKMKLI